MPQKKNSKTKTSKTSKATLAKTNSPVQIENLQSIEIDPLYVVGIGASAGGLDALEKFFKNMPSPNNIAFVVITHLDPSHNSILPELIQNQTKMKVKSIQDSLKIEPETVYIAPPNNDVGMINSTFQLIEPIEKYGYRLPIDYFFQNLAADQNEKAICVILSGMGTDGTLGVKEIKHAFGMIIVQSPESAKYNGMPKSAIDTGLVDHILEPEQMPNKILRYIEQVATATKFATIPDNYSGNALSKNMNEFNKQSIDMMQKIFITLRNYTGHDFSKYKRNTIFRRIDRRMNVHQINNIDNYFKYLQKNKNEINSLFKDLLIGVTRFFRDQEAFEILRHDVFPQLFENKPFDYTIRIWIPGCSTGEEAYSIAIILKEYIDQCQKNYNVQIFATDLDSDAIETARNGLFPANIVNDVRQERLARFFIKQEHTFQIKKEIRELIIFAPQDIIKDPPFTKLDLISCRNFLIYIENDLQKKIIPLFHYALSSDGILLLGSSETIGGFMDLFSIINKKWKIYQRKENEHAKNLYIDFPIRSSNTHQPNQKISKALKLSHAQLVDRILLRNLSPACALINHKGEILYIHGRTGKYLEPTQGDFRSDIIQMARQGLKFELQTAMNKAIHTNKEIVFEQLTIEGNGNTQRIDLKVIPINEPDAQPDLLLVVFENRKNPIHDKPATETNNTENKNIEAMQHIEKELHYTKENLQTTIEELETSNEELKSTNEELQSTNEELQSTNEELETSKEEQQSLNEELQTVNHELQGKIEELSKANNDMKNLLNSLEVPTVFLDNDFCIKRYTSQINKIMNLIQTDTGRSIHDIVIKIKESTLIEDAQSVLKNLIFKEREIQTNDGTWYLMRILPYRTMENVIDGVVVTFLDIHEQKKAKNAINQLNIENQDAREYAESIIETLQKPILVLDKNINIISANKSFYLFFNVSTPDSKNIIGKTLYTLENNQWDIPALRELLEQIIPRDNAFNNIEIEHEFPTIGFKKLLLNAKRITSKGSKQDKILLMFDEINKS